MKATIHPLLLAVVVLLSVAVPIPASAMDTKSAGRCIALGALSPRYEAKAEAVLATATTRGYEAVVRQRVREEFAYLARHKNDKNAKDAWTHSAVAACDRF